MINKKINYMSIQLKARLVKSAREYYWSKFRSFYCQGDGRALIWKRDGNGAVKLAGARSLSPL
ncbi:MAG TPA: hypothetical protein VL866_08615 [Pyrinomonadaceae bacterium]|nr:hypothetical protein [Pyrinomonadaceae bacterium]